MIFRRMFSQGCKMFGGGGGGGAVFTGGEVMEILTPGRIF